MCPRIGRVNSERTFVGHVLAVETEDAGVILVDTGIGASARLLRGLPDDVVAIPLPGHTRGHVAVAVKSPAGWLLHCGDAYFHRDTVRRGGAVPPANRRFEQAVAADWKRVQRNHERLTALAETHRTDVRLMSAHDPEEFRELAGPPA